MIMDGTKYITDDYVIFKGYAGSHSYGTSLPTSDVDIRGLFCADPINIRTPFFPVREVEDSSQEDTKFHELTHFMKLCLECNPNILEMLWLDRSDILLSSAGYELLRNNREKLLSKKIAFTTSGYALSQLKRIKGHNKWINNPQPIRTPQPIDFLSLVQDFSSTKMLPRDFKPRELRDDCRLVPYGNDLYGLYMFARLPHFSTKNRQLYDDEGSLNTLFEGERHLLPMPASIVKFNKEEYKIVKEKHFNYWNWKKNRNAARAKLEQKYNYDCYADDTEFLTQSGWKLFDDITCNEKLATFHVRSHEIAYHIPSERFDALYTGNMYNLTGHHTDTLVTANHRMFIKQFSRTNQKYAPTWTFTEASLLPESFDSLHVISPKSNRQKLPSLFNINILGHVTIINYLRVMGWYISNGTCTFTNNKVSSIVISQSKPQSKLTQNLNRQRNLGNILCTENIYEARGLANYPEHKWCFKKDISTMMYNDCGHGSLKKRIPNWVFELTKREMSSLLTALLQGDGTKKNHQEHTYVYYTANSLLADDVQRLAFLCGYETAKWGPYDIENSDTKMFHIHINKNPSKQKRHQRSASITKTAVQNQRIVCFTIKNNTLITRRNGKIGLHGNCKHAMHLVRLLKMGKEALTIGQIIVKRPDANELLEIRNGKWSYDKVIEYAEHMDNEIRTTLYNNSDLPKNPDLTIAAKLLMEVQDLVWNNRIHKKSGIYNG
jgi:phage pi2 protein 07